MKLRSLDIKGLFFVVLLVGLGILMVRLFSPFLDIIIVALVLTQLFYPVYKHLHKHTRLKSVASIVSTAFAFMFVIIPIIVIGFLAAFEIAGIVDTITSEGNQVLGVNTVPEDTPVAVIETEDQTITDLEIFINQHLNSLDQNLSESGIDIAKLLKDANLIEDTNEGEVLRINLTNATVQVLDRIQGNITPALTGLISGGINVLFFTFLLIVTLIYMFAEYENLPKHLSKISPLEDELDALLFKKFTDTNRGVILGSFAVAIAQATAVIVMMLVLGIGAPILLWLIMVLFSLIPVGSGIIWLPVGIVLLIIGRPIEGILLIIYSGVIINVIDTYLRPRVMKHTVQLHPLVIIFSALGGLTMFGPLGILYGPVIAVFFTSLMEIYVDKYSIQSNE